MFSTHIYIYVYAYVSLSPPLNLSTPYPETGKHIHASTYIHLHVSYKHMLDFYTYIHTHRCIHKQAYLSPTPQWPLLKQVKNFLHITIGSHRPSVPQSWPCSAAWSRLCGWVLLNGILIGILLFWQTMLRLWWLDIRADLQRRRPESLYGNGNNDNINNHNSDSNSDDDITVMSKEGSFIIGWHTHDSHSSEDKPQLLMRCACVSQSL